MSRGYFAIGITGAKSPENVGTLMRTASNFGAAFTFTVGRRYSDRAANTVKSWRHLPHFDWDFVRVPRDALVVAIEIQEGAKPLSDFTHPERALYMLGAEDTGVPEEMPRDYTVYVPTRECMNVAVTGGIVMYDRQTKEGQNGNS